MQKKYNVQVDPEKPASSPGLSTSEAQKRLEEQGPNQLSPPKKTHPFVKFLHSLMGLFNLLLLVAGIACYILLAISFEENKPNVSDHSQASGLPSVLELTCSFSAVVGGDIDCRSILERLHRVLPRTKEFSYPRVLLGMMYCFGWLWNDKC